MKSGSLSESVLHLLLGKPACYFSRLWWRKATRCWAKKCMSYHNQLRYNEAVSQLQTKLKDERRNLNLDLVRSIALLLVLFFHFFPTVFPKGYVGVDLFFVLSGFLIMQQIYRTRTSPKWIKEYVIKRYQRIIPNLLFICVLVLFLSLSFDFEDRVLLTCKQLLASLVGLSNVFYYQNSGYFERGADTLPLLHTWSLSVEVSFYLLLPIIVKLSKNRSKKTLLGTLIVTVVFVFMVLPSDFLISYYSNLLRGIEFGLGVCAFLIKQRKNHIKCNWINLVWYLTTLILIVLSSSLFRFQTWSPSETLLSGVLCFCIVLTASKSNSTCLPSLTRIFYWVGRRAYAIYIVHFPIKVLAPQFISKALATPLFLMLSSLVIGSIVYFLIEEPFSRTNIHVTKITIMSHIMLIFLSLAVIVISSESRTVYSQKFLAAPCDFASTSGELKNFCTIWNPDAVGGTVLVWGDSFSNSWMPAFLELAEKNRQKVVQVSHAACPPIFEVRRDGDYFGKDYCDKGAIQEELRSNLKKINPSKIFVLARWNLYVKGLFKGGTLIEYAPILELSSRNSQVNSQPLSVFRDKVSLTALELSKFASVTFVSETPSFDQDVLEGNKFKQVKKLKSYYLQSRHDIDLVFKGIVTKRVEYLDVTELVCNKDMCPSSSNGELLYSDDAHPSAALVLRFIKPLQESIYQQ